MCRLSWNPDTLNLLYRDKFYILDLKFSLQYADGKTVQNFHTGNTDHIK